MIIRPIQQFFSTRHARTALSALGLLALNASVHATQTVQPVRDVAGTAFAGGGTAWTASVPVGTAVTVIGRYTTTAADGNESGLGLKVKYDETKFAAGSVTVTALSTKCMIAPPQVQSAGAASQAVLGWIDTAARSPAGSVGWPYLADPASAPPTTSPCLNSNTPANDTSATAAGAVNLFRFQGTLASAVAAGSTTDINITADGNFSYAAASPGMLDQKVTITAAAAPSCSLDVDGSGSLQTLVDGVLIVRGMLNLTGASLNAGITFPPGATRIDPTAIANFLASQNYDIDGSGAQQTLVDGVILVRLMLSLPDTSLLTGITLPPSATFTTAAAIRANVNSRCGTSF